MEQQCNCIKLTRFPRPLPRGRPRVAPREGLPRPRLFDFLLGELSESLGLLFRRQIS